VETELLVQADRLVGGSDAVLVIDHTAIPKKGTHSVGSLRNMIRHSARPPTARRLTLARGEDPDKVGEALCSGTGRGVAKARLDLAEALGVPAEQVRVLCEEMGGNFGTRNLFYPEWTLLAWAAHRIVVTHAQFAVVNMSLKQMKQATSMGAKLELCAIGALMGPAAHYEWMRHWRDRRGNRGDWRPKLHPATDLGQAGNPTPPDGLQFFVIDLMKVGIGKDEIIKNGS
jgi:hypothetical protein